MEITTITMEEFASKMGISRSTAYSWKAKGQLVVGRHIIQIGRITRVIWSDDLLQYLLTLSAQNGTQPKPTPLRIGRGARNRQAFDADAAGEFLGLNKTTFPGISAGCKVNLEPGRKTPGNPTKNRGYDHEF